MGKSFAPGTNSSPHPVAIKLTHQPRPTDSPNADLFLREARIVARLDHPNIVPVYEFGQLPDGRDYIVSKWIEGANLAQTLRQKRLDFFEAASLIATLAEALQEAHRQKIVQRDIKPANILIETNGRPYLADFGLAVVEEDYLDASNQGLTPAYASPEQARGEGHLVDGRSDIFSLGAVLYELLTGQRPFPGHNTAEILERIATTEARPPRQLELTISEGIGADLLEGAVQASE